MWSLSGSDFLLYCDGTTAVESSVHQHYALQMSLARVASVEGTAGEASFEALTGVLVGRNVPHVQQGHELLLFVDPLHGRGRRILSLLQGKPWMALDSAAVRQFLEVGPELAGETMPALEDVEPRVTAFLDALCEAHPAPPLPDLDPRIERVIAHLAMHLDERVPLAELARIAGVSPSRLTHLFTEQVGVSIRQYLVWLRILSAVNDMARESRLTELAHEQGFVDQPAFTRAYRKMWGRTPSTFQKAERKRKQ